MPFVVGIHLGNTTCCVALSKDGRAEVAANSAGYRVTPSLVMVDGDSLIAGNSVKQQIIRCPEVIMSNMKPYVKFCGSATDGPVVFEDSRILLREGLLGFQLDGREELVTLESAYQALFKNLIETARDAAHEAVEDAVIAVPSHLNEQARLWLCEVAENAGLNVVRVINEPSAALLACEGDSGLPEEECFVLVARIGGSSSDYTVLKCRQGLLQIVSSLADDEVSGRHVDLLLCDYLLSEFKRIHRVDVSTNPRCVAKVRAAAELCKHVLSQTNTATCSVDSLHEGCDLNLAISRARLENLIRPWQGSIQRSVRQCAVSARIPLESIRKVLLVGGCCRMPSLLGMFSELFPSARVVVPMNPDETVALGAALTGAAMTTNSKVLSETGEVEVECLTTSIYLQGGSGQPVKLVSRGEILPIERKFTFSREGCQLNVLLKFFSQEPGSGSEEHRHHALTQIVLTNLDATELRTAMVLSLDIRRDGRGYFRLEDVLSKKSLTHDVEVELVSCR